MSLQAIFITGPTAIGKTSLALSLAKKYNGYIINSDSMQVYKELKILTARPTIDEQKNIEHFLFGHVSGRLRYNVAQWCNDIIDIIKSKKNKKKVAIVVGGTGLYINSLLNGIATIPNIEEKYKEKSKKILLEIGTKEFYKIVHAIDKISCEKISVNDSQRLQRIWEVYQATKKPLSEWINQNHKIFLKNFKYQIFLFLPNREKIYKTINKRFVTMINNGAIEEVKNLLSMKLNLSLPIMKAHGVPEISNFLSGIYDLEECISKGQQVTRNYAKRQITWWKSSKLNNINNYDVFPSDFEINFPDFP